MYQSAKGRSPTKTNRYRATHQRRPYIMKFQDTFALWNGVQSTGDTMTDVIFYNFPDKKRGKEYTNHRENKVPEVYIIATETFDQKMLNEMYGGF